VRIALVGAEVQENLAIRYIGAALEADGHEVVLVAFDHQGDTERVARRIASSGARMAGYSMVFTARAHEFAHLATRARALGFTGLAVAGGHFATFNAESLLRDVPAIDAVACGEGEALMRDIALHMDDLPTVRGLVWRDGDGEIRRNEPAISPSGLDHLPHPIRKQPYFTYLGLPIVNILSSRGCTHACAFCSISAWHRACKGPRFRMRSPDAVAEEMADLYRGGVRIFNFQDDNFLPGSQRASIERSRALKAELDRRGVGKIAFAIKARPDEVDPELFGYLKSMGLFRVFLGIEAGSADSLQKLQRGQTTDDNHRALRIMNDLGLHACFNLLLLNPDSTLEDLAENVDFLRAHDRNPMNFCRTEVYAGTPLEKGLRRQGRLLGDYWGYDYEIADPRAQQAFEIMRSVLEDRSRSDFCVQHTAMSVDFEHQLLEHFFQPDRDLRQRVKAYVAEVNRNTCAYLYEIVDMAIKGSSSERFLDDLKSRIEDDDRVFFVRGDKLLKEVRLSAKPAEQRTAAKSLGRTAVAAGLATSLLVSGPGCRGDGAQNPPVEPAVSTEQPLERTEMPASSNEDEESGQPNLLSGGRSEGNADRPTPSKTDKQENSSSVDDTDRVTDEQSVAKYNRFGDSELVIDLVEDALSSFYKRRADLARNFDRIPYVVAKFHVGKRGAVSAVTVETDELTKKENKELSRYIALQGRIKAPEAVGKRFEVKIAASRVRVIQNRARHEAFFGIEPGPGWHESKGYVPLDAPPLPPPREGPPSGRLRWTRPGSDRG
jgi:anaerobic magnesium-protoporphyrin IX monomethyl ester cyclase